MGRSRALARAGAPEGRRSQDRAIARAARHDLCQRSALSLARALGRSALAEERRRAGGRQQGDLRGAGTGGRFRHAPRPLISARVRGRGRR